MMEDFHFPQYHSSLFVIIKIMKQNDESTDLDRLRLSDSTAASTVASPGKLVCENSFFMLKISQTLFISVKIACNSTYLIFLYS